MRKSKRTATWVMMTPDGAYYCRERDQSWTNVIAYTRWLACAAFYSTKTIALLAKKHREAMRPGTTRGDRPVRVILETGNDEA